MQDNYDHIFDDTLLTTDVDLAWSAWVGYSAESIRTISQFLALLYLWISWMIIEHQAPFNRYLRVMRLPIPSHLFILWKRALIELLWSHSSPQEFNRLALKATGELIPVFIELCVALLLDVLQRLNDAILDRLSKAKSRQFTTKVIRIIVKSFVFGLQVIEYFWSSLTCAMICYDLCKDALATFQKSDTDFAEFATSLSLTLLFHGFWLHMTIQSAQQLYRIWMAESIPITENTPQKTASERPLWLPCSPPKKSDWAVQRTTNSYSDELYTHFADHHRESEAESEVNRTPSQTGKPTGQPDHDDQFDIWSSGSSSSPSHQDRSLRQVDQAGYPEALGEWVFHTDTAWTQNAQDQS